MRVCALDAESALGIALARNTRPMAWTPDPDTLRGRVAVVAGATRGAGRGIAAALGEAGATVVITTTTIILILLLIIIIILVAD